jgi:tetratricopeptide (TPR) repeat protein
VLGVPTEEPIVIDVAVLPESRAEAAVTEALGSTLLYEVRDGVYDFRHTLARQAVEEAIPSPVRRRLHMRAARALEATEPKPLARLAHHFKAARKTKEWIHYAEAAADRAVSLQDDATAYEFLRDAVGVAGLSPSTRGRLAVKLATHGFHCLEHEETIAIVRRLLDDQALPTGVRGELRTGLGRLLYQAGQTEAGYSEVAKALDELGRRPDLAARAMAFLGRPWTTDGRIVEHLEWMDRAVRTAARAKDRLVRMSVSMDRAVTLLSVGDPRAWTAIEEIPEPGTTADELKLAAAAQSNLASAAIKVGHYGRAEDFIRTGLQLAAGTGNVQAATALQGNRIELDWLVGRWDDLEQRARSHIEAMEDWPQFRGHGQVVLGLLLLAHGDLRSALRLLESDADDFHGTLPMLNWLSGGLARIRLAQGKPEVAVKETARALDPIRQKEAWVWAADVTPAAVQALLAIQRPRR